MGFIRDKRLSRYYLNGVDAYRLKLLLPLSEEAEALLLLKEQNGQNVNKGEALDLSSTRAMVPV